MKDKRILEGKAGREMSIDRAVAGKIMDWVFIDDLHWKDCNGFWVKDGLPFQPSINIADAWLVVEKMWEMGFDVNISQFEDDLWHGTFHKFLTRRNLPASAETAQMAICKAALEAVK